jgi:hypothetical protein
MDMVNGESGITGEEKISCYRCGNLYQKDELKLFGYLCDSCFAELKDLIPSDCVTPGGTQVRQFQHDNEVMFWAMYHPTNGDEIKEIARHLQRNLVPVNAWAIQMQHGTSYLLVVGNFGEEIVQFTMNYIDPQVPTTNLKQIACNETDLQRALGRVLSEFILGKPCENKLEMTIHEVGEITSYAADLIKSGLPPVEVIEQVLTKFYVADPITRKYAFIGSLCSSSADMVAEAKNAGLIPQEW